MKRVMLVDDSLFMRKVLTNILLKNGFEIAGEAKNGIEAISLYSRIRPDLVFMDITMSEMNGIVSLQEIKKIDPYAVVIMCSSMGQQSMITDSFRAGAKQFIIKPFKEEEVIKILNNIVDEYSGAKWDWFYKRS